MPYIFWICISCRIFAIKNILNFVTGFDARCLFIFETYVFDALHPKSDVLNHNIYIKLNVCLSNNTYVFEPSFSDISFTGWFEFSFIFSAFSGLTAFISGIWYFFLHFYFSIYQVMAKWIHVGWFHTYEGLSLALERSWYTCLSAGVATVCWK